MAKSVFTAKKGAVRRTASVPLMLLAFVAAALFWSATSFVTSALSAKSARGQSSVARQSTVVQTINNNPVKTVADSVAGFYSNYPQPPLLPLYRPLIVDLISSAHLALVNARFSYDAIWALGFREYFLGLMSGYDQLVTAGESEKIWAAALGALGLDLEKVNEDAQAMAAYAKSHTPAQILADAEGQSSGEDEKFVSALQGIKEGLYSQQFSVGLFKIMEYSGVELKKANVEEWTKALGITSDKATRDLDTYLQAQEKMRMAMEMIREVEIREKKKLAERLEQKAKALAAKAAAKADGAEPKEG